MDQKLETRRRIVEGAGKGFRKGGFGGIGVDALAKEAGVTSGAFYVHFKSKSDAFCEAIAAGMADLHAGILAFQEQEGTNWWPAFVHFYLGPKRQSALADSCALQCLAPEVVRADPATREVFENSLRMVAQAILEGPPSAARPQSPDAAFAALATLAGAVTLARAVATPDIAEAMCACAAKSLLAQAE
jgi:TetR/AcrR family transcriptional regulator, transcriptional repressor for nem operon